MFIILCLFLQNLIIHEDNVLEYTDQNDASQGGRVRQMLTGLTKGGGADEGGRGNADNGWRRGKGGVWTPPFLADIICELPLRGQYATSEKSLSYNVANCLPRKWQHSNLLGDVVTWCKSQTRICHVCHQLFIQTLNVSFECERDRSILHTTQRPTSNWSVQSEELFPELTVVFTFPYSYFECQLSLPRYAPFPRPVKWNVPQFVFLSIYIAATSPDQNLLKAQPALPATTYTLGRTGNYIYGPARERFRGFCCSFLNITHHVSHITQHIL